jgi:hypothetical protein
MKMARPFEWENRNALLVQTGANEVRTRPGGTPKWIRDDTLNCLDKSFIVPEGKYWEILFVGWTLKTSAVVGYRNVRVNITNGTDLVLPVRQSANVAASTSSAAYVAFGNQMDSTFGAQPLLTNGTDAAVAQSNRTLPKSILPAGYVLRIYELNSVDAEADELTVVIHYIEYDA